MTNWSPKDKKLLIDYYNQGMSIEELGKHFTSRTSFSIKLVLGKERKKGLVKLRNGWVASEDERLANLILSKKSFADIWLKFPYRNRYNLIKRITYLRKNGILPAKTKTSHTISQYVPNEVRAYVAGLFDGEGSLTLGYGSKADKDLNGQVIKRRFYPSVQIVITNASRALLESVKTDLLIGKIFDQPSDGKNRVPSCKYKIYTFKDAVVFLQVLLPFLRLKKAEALVVIEALTYLINQKTNDSMAWQPEHIKVFNDYVLKVRSLKTCSKNRVNGRIKARIVERPEIYV